MPAFEKDIHVLGFPMDLGAGRRGVDMGPSALRIAGIVNRLRDELNLSVKDLGDIVIHTAESEEAGDESLRYLNEIARASEQLCGRVKSIMDDGHFPLILGGDHSMSIGSIAGIGAHCEERGKRLGVIWVDAHSDVNVPQTTPSGNIHGMPLAVAMGFGHERLTAIGGTFPKVAVRDVAIIGARDIDAGERELIRTKGIPTYTMYEIDRDGIYSIIKRVLDRMRRDVDHIHVSFDLDSVDPTVAKGVGTPVPGGLSYREAHMIMETIAESGKLGSFEVVEVNPTLDDMNRSAEFAVGCTLSCFGKRIL